MPPKFSRPIYALRQLKERMIPSKDTLTFTLAVEYGESVLSIHQREKLLWTHKIPFAAMEWMEAVIAWLRYRHKLQAGIPQAERILRDIGSVVSLNPERSLNVKGHNLTGGLPATVSIDSLEVRKQITGLHVLVDRLKWFTGQYNHPHPQIPCIPNQYLPALQYTPIVITGQYNWLRGLPEYLESELGFKFIRAATD